MAELDENDILSIVTFDETARTVLAPTHVRDKGLILSKVTPLVTGGSTNLYDGLKDGFEAVETSLAQAQGYENRVIVITDAGQNTGTTSDVEILWLVNEFAAKGIGLTAIGVGGNFNETLTRGITQGRGGNYVFVQSGRDMYRYFESFDFLVTPVAYALRAGITLADVGAKLEKTYGVPGTASPGGLIHVETLFFTGEGGGAIVLQYKLQ
ncbi:MAG: VWA domain-containing protein [Minicystis sp.]